MASVTSYLQRRGYGLTFRISVPVDLRGVVGCTEITRALPTSIKSEAVPLVLEFAACAKRLFSNLRTGMAELDQKKLQLIVQLAKEKIKRSDLLDEKQALVFQHADELRKIQQEHARDVEVLRIKAERDALRVALTALGRSSVPVPVSAPAETTAQSAIALAAPVSILVPTLKAVVDGFLDRYKQRNKPAMYDKHRPVLSMLLDVVGDKSIDQIKQADINNFFELLGRLPPRWADECRRRKLSVRELAELDFDITLGPKSFEDTYIASVRPFLKAAKKDWQDQGFPLGLTTDGIEYLGDREEDENKQRAFKRDELVRLFQGEEMSRFASRVGEHHLYWILHLGLFTGARVNEICQINPQTDILQDEESGAWYLWITKDTESDSRVRKSVKTGDARKVPIHHKLIELGFIAYVKRVKAGGHKLLFPEWQPINRRASGEAEKWVRQFLRDTNLRDETPKAKILGMHAFRHTLLTYGAMQKPPLSLFCITGHVQDDAPIHATGAGKGYLTLSLLSPLSDRKNLLDQLDYGIAFRAPVAA